MRKKTINNFIEQARKVHGEKYDYSKSIYVGSLDKLCIICPNHGEFWQIADNHLHGAECPECRRMAKRSTTEQFINKCREIYGDFYNYSKVEYTGNKNKVRVICPKHGEFRVTPNNHLRGSRCPSCYGTPKKSKEQFITEARKVHGDKYDYSKVEYYGTSEKVLIICSDHGEFWQTPYSHLAGRQCPLCSNHFKYDQKSFIGKSKSVHKDKYDYSKVKFKDVHKEVSIICPIHGEFWQKPSVHIRGYGCPACGGSERLTTKEFIKRANKIHDGKYDYSKVNYINYSTKVCIICPEHGEFWQVPNNHLFGSGCPGCIESLLEDNIRKLLTVKKLVFEAQKTFDWLKYRKKMFLDFFLPEYSIAIECQGRQHFGPSDYYGGIAEYQLVKTRDEKKKELCEKHGIKVLYYSNLGIHYPYNVIERKDLLLKAIKVGASSDSTLWKDPELPFIFDD